MEILGPGSIIGLPAAMNGTYSATAKALTDSDLGFISAERVLELLASDPALCRAAMRMMSQGVGRMRSSIAEHCTMPLRIIPSTKQGARIRRSVAEMMAEIAGRPVA
jgi:CRP-like cAMP-binding protein